MNGKIKILDESVANIIAAGEVVENPASMIKELIENSLDAGADSIMLEVEKGGRYVKISDNGSGMGKDDLYLSIERHATSKIVTKEDIFNLKTLGFRGEALASIAAVSKLTISSKIEEESVGNSIFVSAGSIRKTGEISRNRGTEIEVVDLFKNTPARLKFLRTEATEYGKIKDIVLREALGNAKTAFTLKINGKESMKTSGKGLESCIMELFGKNVLKNMIKTDIGYLGNQEIMKSTKEFIFTYFNGRYAKSQVAESAVIDGYYTKTEKGKYPFAIIFIDIPTGEIDVNVHPSKKIVKFSNGTKVYDMIKNSINESFAEKEMEFMPLIQIEEEIKIENREENIENKVYSFKAEMENGEKVKLFETKEPSVNYIRNYEKEPYKIENREDINNMEENREIIKNKEEKIEEKRDLIRNRKVIGQIRNMYIMCEGSEGIEIYDQHIVHERILYEELKEKFYGNGIAVQTLLFPFKMDIDEREKGIIFENIDIFNKFGFDIEEFGERDIVVRAVPHFDFRKKIEEVLKELIADIVSGSDMADIREQIIVSMSCKGAVKAGEYLTQQEMEILIEKLIKIGKYTCPHGRPIILKLSFDEMDKKFGRK